MNSDRYQDKYNEVFSELKKEKMNLDFEDFLKKTENAEHQPSTIEPSQEIQRKTLFSSKVFWLAASVVLIAGLLFAAQFWNQDKPTVNEQDLIVKQELEKQKDEIFNESVLAAVEDTLKNGGPITEDTLTQEMKNPDEIIDRITPKRGRLKKITHERYTQNNIGKSADSNAVSEYQDNYVIINGHKIKSEAEAIDIARYSFQILSDNVAKTIASSVVQERPTEE